jgi:hypothetical protein
MQFTPTKDVVDLKPVNLVEYKTLLRGNFENPEIGFMALRITNIKTRNFQSGVDIMHHIDGLELGDNFVFVSVC